MAPSLSAILALIRKPMITALTPKPVFLVGEEQPSYSKLIFGQSESLPTAPEDAAFPSQDLATLPKQEEKASNESLFSWRFYFLRRGSPTTDFSLLELAFRSHQIHSP